MNGKKWLTGTIGISIFLLLLLGVFMYWKDPYNYYGNNHQLYLNDKPAFAAAGAIRQEDYNTAVIGSSLSLGISEDYVSSALDCTAINLSYSGCTAEQRKLLIDALSYEGKADVIICDLLLSNYMEDGNHSLNEMQMDAFPAYLYDHNSLNDMKYLYNYDILLKMMPRVMVSEVAAWLERPAGKSYFQPYAAFHEDSAWPPAEDWTASLDALGNTARTVTPEDAHSLTAAMRQKVDAYLTEAAANHPDQKIIFYFPPYSALYWCEAEQTGYLDCLLDTKEYIASALAKYDNVSLYDFQTLDITLDLQNYHDSLHYAEPLDRFIIDAIARQEELLMSYDKMQDKEQILSLISAFRKAYDL